MINSRITRSIEAITTDSSSGIFQYSVDTPRFMIGELQDAYLSSRFTRRPITYRRRR
jgi:hypothetical protein